MNGSLGINNESFRIDRLVVGQEEVSVEDSQKQGSPFELIVFGDLEDVLDEEIPQLGVNVSGFFNIIVIDGEKLFFFLLAENVDENFLLVGFELVGRSFRFFVDG